MSEGLVIVLFFQYQQWEYYEKIYLGKLFSLKNLVKIVLLTLFNCVNKKFLQYQHIIWASSFLVRSFNLINFESQQLLLDIDICKPDIIQGLSLSFGLNLETFSKVSRYEELNFSMKALYKLSTFMFDVSNTSQSIENQQQNFLHQILGNRFIFTCPGSRGIQGDIQRQQKLWEVV